MKGNDGTGNVIERDDWETPQWLFDKLNKQYKFGFDCCASKENAKIKPYFEYDFLDLECADSTAWMNPPFSKADAMFKHFFKIIDKGVCIYRCDNLETALWQDVILKNASWILIPKGRISYEGKVGKGSRFPSALIGFNVKPPKDIKGSILITTQSEKEGNLGTKESKKELKLGAEE